MGNKAHAKEYSEDSVLFHRKKSPGRLNYNTYSVYRITVIHTYRKAKYICLSASYHLGVLDLTHGNKSLLHCAITFISQ